jgi:hypothetical protein
MSFFLESLSMGTLAALAPSPHNVGLTMMSVEGQTGRRVLAFCMGALATDALILISALMLGGNLSSPAIGFAWLLRLAGSAFYVHLALRMLRAPRAPSATQPGVRQHGFFSGAWVQSCNPNPFFFWFLIGAPRALALFRSGGWSPALLYVGAFLATAYLGKLLISHLIRRLSAQGPLRVPGLRYAFSPLLLFLAVQNILKGVST